MNTIKIITLGVLVALTGVQCWGAAAQENPLDQELLLALIGGFAPKLIPIVEDLLQRGANPNARETSNRSYGRTVLIMAAGKTPPQPEVVQMLLDYGAKIDERDRRGQTAMDAAKETKESIKDARARGHYQDLPVSQDDSVINILTRETDEKEEIIAQELEKSRIGGAEINLPKIRSILGVKATAAEIRAALHIQMAFDKLDAMRDRD